MKAAREINFDTHEKRNVFLKFLLIGVILFVANYLIKACDYVNSSGIDNNIANTYFFDSSTTYLYYFKTDSIGQRIEYDENKEIDQIDFTYEVSDKGIVTIEFYNATTNNVSFKIIKDGLLNLSDNKIFYKY